MSAHMETNTGVDNRKFGMWCLIASECFLFGTLIANYLINRDRGLTAQLVEISTILT